MKIYKSSRDLQSIYGMANLRFKTTGEPFDLWVDEAGSERNTQHDAPRFKPKANGIQLDIIIQNDGTAEIVNTDPRDIQKFGYAKEALAFIERFSAPLLMHWNGEIETGELTAIIRLVVKKHYELDDAIYAVINDEY